MAKAGRPAFSFFVCPDGGLLRQRLEADLEAWPPEKGSWKRLVFWGDEPPDRKFWSALGQQGLFRENRAVIVRNGQDWPAAIWKEISSVLSRLQTDVWPLFCLEVGEEKGKFKIPAAIARLECFEKAEKKGWIWRDRGLLPQQIKNYVVARTKKMGIKMSREALEIFCERVPADALTIDNELKKLAAAGVTEITPSFINMDNNPENDAFACIRKLQACDLASAWRMADFNGASSFLFFLIALLSREYRLLWSLLQGESVRMQSFEVERKRNLAFRLGSGGIAKGFSLLTDAEWGVKSGRQSPEQALEFLLAETSLLFAPKGRNNEIPWTHRDRQK